MSHQTKISFVTIGIFLNYLIHDPIKLRVYDCIILDEVHERDLNLDFVLMILKILINKVGSLKIILMSATLETEKIAKYFSSKEIFKASQLCEKQLQKFYEAQKEFNKSKFENKREHKKEEYGNPRVKNEYRG